ncbi:hypothetical protein TSUD_219430 [Trifolium subterraneum]|uniref:Uncharacterized protein n=1 Tax=Trifolium subterraneum TaxID=3900 RepID=A0A2Z6NE56_TRISU|nr:hypothetical protein TSUD_219430 [Trifolium subterraneum]
MSNVEEENHMLREQVTTMQTEIEKLTSMVTSLIATHNQAPAPVPHSSSTFVPPPVSSAPFSTSQYVMPEGYPWGMPVGFLGDESRPVVSEIPHVQSTVLIPQLVNTLPQVTATVSAPLVHTIPQTQMPIFHAESVGGYDRMDDLQIKYDEMQKEMRALRGKDLFGQDAHELCLVLDVVVPHKFKVPDFEKYKGSTCPKAHLIMYARKMSTQTSNDKLLIHYFQDSLTGAALRWYMDLDRANVSSFNDLASAFIRQYNYNSYLAPDRDELRALAQKERESFKEYAQRRGSPSGTVDKRECSNFSTTKKYGNSFSKKKESEVGMVAQGGPQSRYPTYQHVSAITPTSQPQMTQAPPPQYPHPYQQPYPQQPQIRPQTPQQPYNYPNRTQRNPPFDPIPMKYADLLPALLAKNFVQTRPPPPVPAVLPTWYRSDLTCAFHQGAPGHDVERCYALKKAVQELIRNKVLSFKDENPNVRNNPLPNHGSSVHFIQGCQETSTILSVKDIKTPLVPILSKMCEAKLFSHDHVTCEECLKNPQGCSRVQEDIQRLMDKGELLVTKKSEDVCVIVPEFNTSDCLEMIYNSGEPTVNPLVICLPGPMPYMALRAVPYRYDATMLQDGVEIPIPPLISVDNIADNSKILRSGRILPGVVQEKTGSSVEKTQIPDSSGTSERVYEDSDEVLKMIKRSEYKIVDQLLQTPSKISILSLLMNSDAHREALMKVLDQEYVDHDAMQGDEALHWGRLLQLAEGQKKEGLGCTPSTKKVKPDMVRKPITDIFLGAGFINVPPETNAIIEHEDEEEPPSFVTPGGICCNWVIVDVPSITPLSKLSINKPVEHNDPRPSPNFEFPVYEAVEEEDEEIPDEIRRLVDQEKRTIQPHKEVIELINLGSEEEKNEIKIEASLETSVKERVIVLLREYVDIFAWSYQDMPGLDPEIVEHHLPLKPECPPVKQRLRRTHPDMALKIKEEVQKQIDAGFLITSEYPQWLANIVPVPKKDGKVRMCVDYRDLNKASPKDDFPLPHIDVLVDNTAKSKVFSFMDGFSRYNQIKMAVEDREKTAFITPWGTFCYKVMPFGLTNAGATYQRGMTTLFHDMMHKEIEVYVDDMIVKSGTEEDHVEYLLKMFQRLRKYRLRLNPNKCTFGVRSGKLLGFIVSQKGIEVDPDKVRAIREMPAPQTEKQVRGFLGRLNYISRFISHMTATCGPIFRLLRKNQGIDWTEDCQKAFDSIKEYLMEPPILIPPVEGRPLIMYLTVLEECMGCVLGQQDDTGRKEHAIYYLSKKYTMLEKTCCALAWAAKRLRHYLINHTTWLISKVDPIKYIFEKAALTGRISRWQMLLSEYDIEYRTQKAIKGIELHHIPRDENQMADALATLSSMYRVNRRNETPTISIRCLERPAYVFATEEVVDDKPWFHDIKMFLQKQEYPPGASNKDRKTLRRLSSSFFLNNEVLYKRNFDMVLLRCVDQHEADLLMHEVHEGSSGTHTNGHTMAKKMLRAGYYWLTMESDCYKHARKCHKCQIYADKMHLPPTSLNVLSSPWPFSMWGIDMIGRIEPKASNGHRFILVAIDYFTKWVEAASYANVTKQVVVRFIKNHIICRYGVPNKIITDNGTNLNNKMMKDLCDEFKVEHHNSSPYRPQMNGAVEAANKNIKKIVQKMVVTYKDWHEMLPFALHGYRTSVRTSTGATPFSLVYGMEAVLPVEVEIPSMRVLMETKLAEAEWCQNRYDQLNLIEEKRMAALCHGQLYQRRMKQAFDRKVRPCEFREGDLVLKKILSFQPDSRGKWTPNYEGPYVVKRAFSGGAMTLATMDGD